jgi:hypothetical protein
MNRFSENKHATFVLLALFAIAMGALEAIVVVYLRQIYYPGGFDFPLTLLSPRMLSVECAREAATIVMLVSLGIMVGNNRLQRFAWFLYAFAIWDIFYYAWLKFLLAWPPSLLTWDVLFLIPVPWIGPVLAPLICSATMIFLAVTLIHLNENGRTVNSGLPVWGPSLLGSAVILFTFIRDYSGIVLHGYLHKGLSSPGAREELLETVKGYTPGNYQWGLFVLGEILILCTMIMLYMSTRSRKRDEP